MASQFRIRFRGQWLHVVRGPRVTRKGEIVGGWLHVAFMGERYDVLWRKLASGMGQPPYSKTRHAFALMDAGTGVEKYTWGVRGKDGRMGRNSYREGRMRSIYLYDALEQIGRGATTEDACELYRERPKWLHVRHLNGLVWDSRFSNLELGTARDNRGDAGYLGINRTPEGGISLSMSMTALGGDRSRKLSWSGRPPRLRWSNPAHREACRIVRAIAERAVEGRPGNPRGRLDALGLAEVKLEKGEPLDPLVRSVMDLRAGDIIVSGVMLSDELEKLGGPLCKDEKHRVLLGL